MKLLALLGSRSVIASRNKEFDSGIDALTSRVNESRAGTASKSTIAAHWLLRIACAWCFVGHGAWGIYQKPGWIPFYEALGVPEWLAWPTMPVIGAFDILLGLSVLVHPCRATLVWMAFWCVFTAALRPLAGMGWWEFLERGGNYAPPMALLALSMSQPGIGWFGNIAVSGEALPDRVVTAARWILRAGIAVLLIGHGGFGAFEERAMLVDHWSAIGVDLGGAALRAIGWFEIGAGLAVLGFASAPLLVGVAVWKTLTELLYPISGAPMDVFEWIERGGDYFAPLALIAMSAITLSGAFPPMIPERSSPRGAIPPN